MTKKPAVRQMRGPGMNLGLKKPRFGFTKPKEYVQPRALKKALSPTSRSGETSSYLPEEPKSGSGSGKGRKPQAPRGKAISGKTL